MVRRCEGAKKASSKVLIRERVKILIAVEEAKDVRCYSLCGTIVPSSILKREESMCAR